MTKKEGAFCPLVNSDCLKSRCMFWVAYGRLHDCSFRVLPMLLQEDKGGQPVPIMPLFSPRSDAAPETQTPPADEPAKLKSFLRRLVSK